MNLEENTSGNSFEYDDYKGIRTFVENRYNLFLNNNSVQSANIEQYSVKNQVGKVAEYLNEISK